jgi:hypothetical protein
MDKPILSQDVFLGEVDVAPEEADLRFYSVTTILKALEKPALLFWSAEQAAKLAVQVANSLPQRIEEEGEEAVIKWLRDARLRKPKGYVSDAELGTQVHDACEQYALTGVRPVPDNDEVLPFLDRFDEWAQEWQPEYEAAEAAVYNKTYGYAGTLDAIVRVDGQRVLLDYKSSRKSVGSDGKPSHPWPEASLQVTAYKHAELLATWRARRFEKYRRRYYLLNTAEEELGVPMPKLEGGVVLHLTPEHATMHPVRTDDEAFIKFLHVIEVFDWANSMAKSAVGGPMTRGGL